MGSDSPISGRCGVKVDNPVMEGPEYCKAYPSKQSNNSLCYVHDPELGKDSPGRSPVEAVDSNRSEYYQNLNDEEREWVDLMIESFVEQSPFGVGDHGKMEVLRQTIIDMHKNRGANAYVQQEGLAQERTVYEDGEPVDVVDENVLNLTSSRLSKDVVKRLKDLGCLDDPSTQQAEATKSLAEILSSDD